MKAILIIILISVFIIGGLGISAVIQADSYLNELIENTDLLEQQEIRHLKKISESNKNYNELYSNYNELNKKYNELKKDFGCWEVYKVTAYTSLDKDCNNISSIGMDILCWDKYFNFCAVDPTVIPYGSTVLVKFDTGIISFLAVDCGGAIKGKHIDLYFGNDLNNAFEFGIKELEVKVINGKI